MYCMYACAYSHRDRAELHVRYDSHIRHGEVERQECVEVGDAAALTLVHHEDLSPILSLDGMPLKCIQYSSNMHYLNV